MKNLMSPWSLAIAWVLQVWARCMRSRVSKSLSCGVLVLLMTLCAYFITSDRSSAWTQQAEFFVSGAAMRDHDFSVSVSGDTAVVGNASKKTGSGSAHVFTRDSSGVWTQQAKLPAPGDISFGFSVSVSGDTAVIGALGDDDNGWYSGSAYVFTRDSSGVWTQQAKLTASDGKSCDQLGRSVSISGDTVVVGTTKGSSAYVFTRERSGAWTQQAKLAASSGGNSYTALEVSISGDTAVVGAYGDDSKGQFSGSAYVFTRDSFGTWTQQAKLNAWDAPPPGKNIQYFGASVSISGDTAVVGALGPGSAYVFNRDSSGVWTPQSKLTSSGVAMDWYSGTTVSISGDTVEIGRRGYSQNNVLEFIDDSVRSVDESLGDLVGRDTMSELVGVNLGIDYTKFSGSAYIFTRDSSGVWTQQAKLTPSEGALDSCDSISISGDTAVVGTLYSSSVYMFSPAN